jgi:hypothetical protein
LEVLNFSSPYALIDFRFSLPSPPILNRFPQLAGSDGFVGIRIILSTPQPAINYQDNRTKLKNQKAAWSLILQI